MVRPGPGGMKTVVLLELLPDRQYMTAELKQCPAQLSPGDSPSAGNGAEKTQSRG